MPLFQRRCGISLVFAGLGGIAFFWLTDPRLGIWDAGIELASQAWIGTLVGIAASAATLVLGLWLLTRRTI